jgi:SAM-dependent methyltransferase
MAAVVHHYEQYTESNIEQNAVRLLVAAGADPAACSASDLYSFDQMHGGGLLETQLHADIASVQSVKVLDLGCGIGGCARYLASECECDAMSVVGVDITPGFIEAATALTARCGLSARCSFICCDATETPLEDGSIDHVFAQNVVMNIADKEAMIAEVARVLRPGGRFSILGPSDGGGGPPIFPLVFADSPETCHLVSSAEMRALLDSGGLPVVEERDPKAAMAEFKARLEAAGRPTASPPDQIELVMGPGYLERRKTGKRNAAEGRVVSHFLMGQKPGGALAGGGGTL